MEKKKINSVMEQTAQQLKSIVDVNTVVGKPMITASGAQVIPLTKVTMAYLTGGGEYGEVKEIKEEETLPFAGGAGTVINLKPTGFLIDDGVSCRLVKISDDPLEGMVEKVSELVERWSAKRDNEE